MKIQEETTRIALCAPYAIKRHHKFKGILRFCNNDICSALKTLSLRSIFFCQSKPLTERVNKCSVLAPKTPDRLNSGIDLFLTNGLDSRTNIYFEENV